MFLETWKEATGNLILTEGKALQQRHDVYQKPTLQFLIFPLYLSKTNIQLPVTWTNPLTQKVQDASQW